jgi:16S rRNA (uracil1498-N3)-methyltransferase
VSAPLYLLDPGALAGAVAGGTLELTGEEARHAVTVRRTRVGERVDLADGAGGVARCTVTGATAGRLVARIDAVERLPPPAPAFVLVQALAKGGRDEAAVETATELGADEIVPWQAERSVVVWSGDRGERSRERWRATARAAAKQSRRPTVPPVTASLDRTGLAHRIAAVAASGGVALVLHEAAVETLAAVPLPPAGAPVDVLLVVGPEGGIGEPELAAFTQAGARTVRLGPTVLRSSSAGPAALAVLAARTGRWQ